MDLWIYFYLMVVFVCVSTDDRAYPFFPTLDENEGRKLDIRIRSRGYDDPCLDDGFVPGVSKCASAIWVNGNVTTVSRGHAVVWYDAFTGKFGGQGQWDTYDDGDSTVSAGAEMANFVADIPDGAIVMLAAHDSANNDVPYNRLARMLTYGLDVENFAIGFRESFCMIGRKGSDVSGGYLPWQQAQVADQYLGPSNCSAVIQTGSYHAEVSGTYEITASKLTWNEMPLVREIFIRVLSIGFDDPGYGCVPNNGCTGT